MPRTPKPLPGPLPPAFRIEDASDLGVSRDMLRHPRFENPHWGVHRLLTEPSGSHLEDLVLHRAIGYAPLLRRGEAFSHTAALLLHKCPVRASAALHVTAQPTHNRVRRAEVIGHRARSPFTVRLALTGLPCVDPVTAVIQSALLLNFLELVVAIDHLLLPRGYRSAARPIASREQFEAVLAHDRSPGIARVRAALSVARVGAESRMETVQHFELARMGMDDLEMQSDVFDRDGNWIGRFDLADRQRKRIMEYDGEQHRTDRRQYLRDEAKLERARQAGWAVRRYHKEDFYPQQIATTRSDMCEFLGRSPIPLPVALARLFAET